MNTERLVQNTGDYSRENVIVTMINPAQKLTAEQMRGGTSKSTQYRQFAIRQDRNYSLDDGTVVEKQPLDVYCTTWNDNIIKMLDNITVGDSINVKGYLEPVWRGYIANDTPQGIRFVIPDTGASEYTVPGADLVVYPTAYPYRLDAQAPGVYVHADKGLNVQELTPATQIRGVSENVPTGAENSFAQLQQSQDNLNNATANGDAPAQDNPAANAVPFGQ